MIKKILFQCYINFKVYYGEHTDFTRNVQGNGH